MGDLQRMVGVPWHTEKMVRREGDDRRHRTRCKYYKKDSDKYCKYYCGKCRGAAHCSHYIEEKTAPQEEIQVSTNKKNKPESFDDIRSINMGDIIIPSYLRKTSPTPKKLNNIIEYFRENGELDKPIVVDIKNDKYILKDKYLRYCAAKTLGLCKIPAEMGTKEEIKNRDALREMGCLVWNQKMGEVGQVNKITLKTVRVKYDSGAEISYDIHKCLSSGTIKLLG